VKTKSIIDKKLGFFSNAKRVIKIQKKFHITIVVWVIVISSIVYAALNKKFQINDRLSSIAEVMPIYLKSMFVMQDTISIDMKHINVQKVEHMRQRAMQNDKEFEYVPAEIRYDNKSIRVKMRLKGDRKIHYDNLDTASYRIKVRGDDTLFGMKTFSIHKPRARNYLYEWVYLRLMEHAGIMAPQYRFVHIKFNGKDLGLYAIEEHYDKYLIERHNKREGPIVRFKEANVNKNHKFISKYHEGPVVPYVGKKWEKQENISITKKAVYLLEGYRLGELSVSEVFDVDKLAMFFAITDLTGTHHGSLPKSLRFYYNPITSRLEPIPFDGHFGTVLQPMLTSEMGITPTSWIYLYWKEFYISFFNDPDRLDHEFIRAYISALSKVSSVMYLDDFFNTIKGEFEQAILATYSELPLEDKISSFGPLAFKFDNNVYYKRRAYIKDKLSQPALNAHIAGLDKQQILVEINRLDHHFPSEVLSLNCGKTVLKPTPETAYLIKKQPLTDIEIHKVSFIIEEGQLGSIQKGMCNEINYRVLGGDAVFYTTVYPWPSYDHNFVDKDVTRSTPNHADFDFIKTDISKKVLRISPGVHNISHNLILPSGFSVVAGPGTTMVLSNSALIYSLSPLDFTGTKEAPVLITSNDKTGQGLVVIGALGQSYLEHVEFTKLRNPDQLGWSIPGAVTFYESPVKMNSVSVHGNKSEDAINIIRSRFDIKSLSITDAFADAVDADFSEGRIYESSFKNAGNDAIDVSGTKIDLENIEILYSGDKGISAGEESEINARNIKMKGNNLSLASKDKSTVRVNGVDVSDSLIAIAAYQKKSEYGPGKVYIEDFNYDGHGIKSLIEQGSLLVIDKNKFPGQESDVENWVMRIYESKGKKL